MVYCRVWQSAGALAAITLIPGRPHAEKKRRFHELLHCSHVESLFVSGVKACEPLI